MALEDFAAKSLAGDLDPLGQADLLLPGQERDLPHLRQVDPDRIADPARDVIEFLRSEFAILVQRLVDTLIGLVIEVSQVRQA